LTSVYSGLVVSGNSNHHQKTIHVYAILAFVTILLIAGVVSHIYRTLKVHHKSKSILDFALVHAPFSLYHGFVVVLVVVSAFNAFGVNAHLHAPKIFTKAFVLAASVLLEATAAGYALTSDGDIMGAGVISFSLLAICELRKSSVLYVSLRYIPSGASSDLQILFSFPQSNTKPLLTLENSSTTQSWCFSSSAW